MESSYYSVIPVQFDSFFKEPKKQIIDYLKLVPREYAIRFALLMSNFKHETNWKTQLEKMAFDGIIKQCCSHILQAIERELKELSKGRQDFEIVLFTQLTGLEILRILFLIPTNDHKFKSHEWQGNLLKVITLVNDELVKDIPSFKNGSLYRFSKSVRTYKYELDDRVVVYAAVYRSMQLLKFLENQTTKECKNIRLKLCEVLETDSLSEHLKFIFKWLERLDFEPKTANQIFRISQSQLRQEFDKFSISSNDLFDNIVKDDYTKFKEKPFISICKGEYAVINNTFAANLIYNRLRYAILNICKKDKICNFFHWYNTEFVEKYLFDSILKYSFNTSKSLCLSEDDCKKFGELTLSQLPYKKREEALAHLPDGYVRCGNKILLLECKGKILSVKALNDERKLIEDLTEDIVSKKKGTGQLIYNCNRILRGDCFWDNGIPKDLVIYPLLVLDDISFSAHGFNSYIIEFTKEYVESHRDAMAPFTAIDIDTFILISELIRDGRLNIFQVIDNYHSFITNATLVEKEISLATYIRANYETESPKIISEWLKSI